MKYPSGVAETEEDLFTRRFLEETGGTCGLVPLSGPSFPVGGGPRPIIGKGLGYRKPVLRGRGRPPQRRNNG